MSQNSQNKKRNIWERLISLASPSVVADYAPPARQVGPNLWVVDRKLRFPGGLTLVTRCTVMRLPNGELLLHSPCELTETTRKNIDALGQVRFLIAPNSFHYIFVSAYLAVYPSAVFYLSPGLAERQPALPAGQILSDTPPPQWGDLLDQAVLGPASHVSEVAFFHRESQTLILTDLAFNMRNAPNTATRIVWDVMGIPRGFGPSRTARLMLLRDRPLIGNFVRRLLEWPFERIIVTHGDVLESGGRGALESAFAAYLQ